MEIANKLCTDFVAKYTGDRGDQEVSLKPDITLFSKNDEPGSLERSSVETSFLQLFVELKRDTRYDPFCGLPDGGMIERESNGSHDTCGQCLLYASNRLAY